MTYNTTRNCCYAGYFVQAVNLNFLPLLFVIFQEQFGLSYAEIGVLVSLGFVVQIAVDILSVFIVDKIGFRITTLGWNEKNTLTGSCITGGGLTEQGRDYVKEAQRVGMVVEVSHISDEGFWDIMEITQKPIIASHSNSRAVWNVPRNLTDEMYLAICKTNGTVGINLYNDFLGEYPTLDTVCDHIIHFMQLAGSDKHVSLGGDLDGCVELPDGFTGVQDYPKLAECLLQRGLCEESVQNIFWNNALGVMEKCSM